MATAPTISPEFLTPLLNPKTLTLVREHVEALEAMSGNRDDRLTATGLRMLLINHDKRAKFWKENQ